MIEDLFHNCDDIISLINKNDWKMATMVLRVTGSNVGSSDRAIRDFVSSASVLRNLKLIKNNLENDKIKIVYDILPRAEMDINLIDSSYKELIGKNLEMLNGLRNFISYMRVFLSEKRYEEGIMFCSGYEEYLKVTLDKLGVCHLYKSHIFKL